MTARVNVKQGLAPAAAKARTRAYRIRIGIRSYIHTLGDIAAAYADEDWKALGYKSWAAYVEAEFGAKEVGLPPEQRQKAIEELRLGGMPNRAIAAALNVSEKTVRNDRAGAEYSAPIEGEIVDSPAKSPLVAAITGAIEDADARNETAGLAGPAPDVDPASAAGTAAVGDRVDSPAAAPHASPGVPANTPGPAETSSAGATGAGSAPAPVADTTDPGVAAPAGSEPSSPEPGPFAAGGEREEAPRLTPDGVPSRLPPAKWTAEEREAHEEEVQVRKDVESAHAFAKTFVTAVRNQCFTILVGYRLGETHLVTADQIADCRRAIDLLEKEVIADAQR
jgi:hypothetical protein